MSIKHPLLKRVPINLRLPQYKADQINGIADDETRDKTEVIETALDKAIKFKRPTKAELNEYGK